MANKSLYDRVLEIATKFFLESMDDDTKRLIRAANASLWYGPFTVEEMEQEGFKDWPGYHKACSILETWWQDNGKECWVDLQCEETMIKEPDSIDKETGEEVCMDDIWHLERRSVGKAIFGELVGNGMDL